MRKQKINKCLKNVSSGENDVYHDQSLDCLNVCGDQRAECTNNLLQNDLLAEALRSFRHCHVCPLLDVFCSVFNNALHDDRTMTTPDA